MIPYIIYDIVLAHFVGWILLAACGKMFCLDERIWRIAMYKSIIPLKTPYGFYYYDCNLNDIVSVNEELFEYILGGREKITDESMEQYAKLRNEGYFKNGIIYNREINEEYIKNSLKNINKIILQITQECNFQCSYCVYSELSNNQRNHSKNKMSPEVAAQAIDFLMEHNVDGNIKIGFYGGEPLLNFKVIEFVVDYVNINYCDRDVHYNMTTNGSLLNNETMYFLYKNKFDLLISFDYSQDMHNRNRHFSINGADTYDIVLKNITTFLQKYPDAAHHIKINSVIEPQYFEKYQFNAALPIINHLEIINNIKDDEYSIDKNIITQNFIDTYKYDLFLELLNRIRFIEIESPSKIIDNEIRAYDNFERALKAEVSSNRFNTIHLGQCIPGTARLLVDIYGNLFPCEQLSETNDMFNIGDVYSGFEMSKIMGILNFNGVNTEECSNCWANKLCSQCIRHCTKGGKISQKNFERRCQNTRENSLRYLKKFIALYEIKNRYEDLCKKYSEDDIDSILVKAFNIDKNLLISDMRNDILTRDIFKFDEVDLAYLYIILSQRINKNFDISKKSFNTLRNIEEVIRL